MRTIETTVYKFNELSEDAKQKAIERLSDINVSGAWWYESVYEDAESAGIKIDSFDLDRHYIKGGFINSAEESAHYIIDNHGEVCESYKTATGYLELRDKIVGEAPRDEDGEFEDEYKLDNDLDTLDNEFKQSILEDYRIMLSKEYAYLATESAIIETIQANDYEFTEDGKIT